MPVVSEAELAKRRHEIIEGARRCFGRHGYEGATVRLLEEETGKSRGAIFHHFGDKESLFLAIAREDAVRQADVVARDGLVEVMRDILSHPERHDWLATRLEITRMVRTDSSFRSRWRQHQEVLDDAVRDRLRRNAQADRMRTDVPVETLMIYLETVMDGLISRVAAGLPLDSMAGVLDLVEASVRKSG
ncbi:TetR/AcrR family transcriptional regulator [Corynebacterium uberis]|uniref:TetR/AcrR family transcriptional regulator n=1 Tax=Corynebacterium TaxID=1716 RepID=UPI001D0AF5A7|nr:TetR/AcrR family transcriptional regulator [Corynebacterium uberis]MCZ9308630.1 TetR/AcrR family transcriptional regulator [Corynebacterium sp. c6VSa_13]UDL74272.1 TetR/AcrR family transcriptional regulator [Corynebacterium uberis]UDL74848.1 TetR/AcrR family transcriptional regulator [Corynebacterium uberis]UDL77062.1 TetR/AcrR family transcriptional regulator [Corynebacterium uberis]UDL79345.1 TetR/AcrR family transcriptional regulator [Corynebacterium uberis]